MNQPPILAKINYKRSISPASALCSSHQCGRDDVPRAAAAAAAGSSKLVVANLFSLVLVVFIRKLLSSAPASLCWITRCYSGPLLFPQRMTSTLLSGQHRDELLPSPSQGGAADNLHLCTGHNGRAPAFNFARGTGTTSTFTGSAGMSFCRARTQGRAPAACEGHRGMSGLAGKHGVQGQERGGEVPGAGWAAPCTAGRGRA
jgi:hypothetical protein